MKRLIRAKAEHCSEYRDLLMTSDEKIIAEAVPDDKYWSAGLSRADIVWCDRSDWPGENMMGSLHMELRAQLRQEELETKVNIRHRVLLFCSKFIVKPLLAMTSPYDH